MFNSRKIPALLHRAILFLVLLAPALDLTSRALASIDGPAAVVKETPPHASTICELNEGETDPSADDSDLWLSCLPPSATSPLSSQPRDMGGMDPRGGRSGFRGSLSSRGPPTA